MVGSRFERLSSQIGSIPDWLVAAAEQYEIDSNRWAWKQTGLRRAERSIRVLDQINSYVERPEILMVGLGIDAEPLIECVTPHLIAAHLQGRGVDYTMTLVDIDEQVINDVMGRNRLYGTLRHFDDVTNGVNERAWFKYLADTGQEEIVLYENDDVPELRFSPDFYASEWGEIARMIGRGLHVARVPRSFAEKRHNGDVEALWGDIAMVELRRQYDYAELMNVLYHLTISGQMLAVANVSVSMREGGLVLLNDAVTAEGTPLFERNGGWVNKSMLGDIGLEVVADSFGLDWNGKPDVNTILLRKFR